MNSYVTGIQWIYYKPDKNGYTKPTESRSIMIKIQIIS